MAFARLNFLLNIATATGILSGLLVLAFCIFIPAQELPEFAVQPKRYAAEESQPQGGLATDAGGWSRDKAATLLSKRLQGPLFDVVTEASTPEEVKQPPARVKPNIEIRLIGTVVESEESKSRAWLKLPSGGDLMLGVGGQIQGVSFPAHIQSIGPKRVVLDLDGFEHVLEQMD